MIMHGTNHSLAVMCCQALPPPNAPPPIKKHSVWLAALWARAHQQQLLEQSPAVAAPRADTPQLAAAAAAPSTTYSTSWQLPAARPAASAADGRAAVEPAAPAVTGDTAGSGNAGEYSAASTAEASISNASTRGYGHNHLQTVAYEPLASGDSSASQAGQSTCTGQHFGQYLTGSATSSSEHATSAAWEAGGSLRASGRGSLSAAPGAAAAAAANVHQRPTGQSLGGFSDVESLL